MLRLFQHKVFVIDIIVVLGVALLFRLWGLGSNPPSLNWDEASLGYNAFAVLQTGHDEWGRFLPISFEAFGEYKLPGYVYATIPFIALFDLTTLAVRLPSAIFGALTVVLTYLLIWRISARRLPALLGAGLLAITPWHFFTSRVALEANLALFFIVLGVYLFIESVGNKPRLFLLSMVSFLIANFTYNSSRVFLPLFILVAVVLFHKSLWRFKRIVVLGLTLFFGVYLLAIPLTLKEGSARYVSVGLLDQGGINRINETRGASQLPDPLPKLVHNKITYFATTTTQNYLHYFSTQYLFLSGGSQYHFSVPDTGLLYAVELPLFFLGLWWAVRTKNRYWPLIVAWLLLAPLPAAITRETPHVLRSLFMLPTFQIFSGLGLFWLISRLREKQAVLAHGFVFLVVVAVTMQGVGYFTTYATTYPRDFSCSWQYGHQQVAEFIGLNKDRYNSILMTKRYGEPHMFLLFYNKIDPITFAGDSSLVRYRRSDHAWVDRFANYQFVDDWELQHVLYTKALDRTGRILVVTSPGNYPRSLTPVKTISFLDGQPAFDLLEVDASKMAISEDDLTPVPPMRGCYTDQTT